MKKAIIRLFTIICIIILSYSILISANAKTVSGHSGSDSSCTHKHTTLNYGKWSSWISKDGGMLSQWNGTGHKRSRKQTMTCNNCQAVFEYTQVEEEPHTWSSPSVHPSSPNDEIRTCTKCGATKHQPHYHQLQLYKVETNGKQYKLYYKCFCGTTIIKYSETIPHYYTA